MMDSSPLHPLLVRMLLPLERRNELRLDSEWTHSVGLGSYLVPLMVEMDDFGSFLFLYTALVPLEIVPAIEGMRSTSFHSWV